MTDPFSTGSVDTSPSILGENLEQHSDEEQVLPLSSEDIVVSLRIAVGLPVDAVPPVREEGDITVIPVVEEVLVVERRLVLKEEIHLRRVRTIKQHRETVTLREQHAVIERTDRDGQGRNPFPEPAPIPKPQALKESTHDR